MKKHHLILVRTDARTQGREEFVAEATVHFGSCREFLELRDPLHKKFRPKQKHRVSIRHQPRRCDYLRV